MRPLAACAPVAATRRSRTSCARRVAGTATASSSTSADPNMLPVAVDAMGGDHAPGTILAGAHRAAAAGVPIVLVGPRDLEGRTAPDGSVLDLIEASEVIGMHDDPAQGVRRKKDSSLVRAAEAVRDGTASAMVRVVCLRRLAAACALALLPLRSFTFCLPVFGSRFGEWLPAQCAPLRHHRSFSG